VSRAMSALDVKERPLENTAKKPRLDTSLDTTATQVLRRTRRGPWRRQLFAERAT